MLQNGSLLLGLRRPLLQKRAILLELRNPDSLDEPDLRVLSLDLNGQGIRAMETVRDGESGWRYYLLGGPSERVNHENFALRGNFSLYAWSGKEDEKGLEELAFPYGSAGGAYEGLMLDTTTGRLWASRDSDHLSDEFPCKERDSAFQSFLMTDLGDVGKLKPKVPPAPGPRLVH